MKNLLILLVVVSTALLAHSTVTVNVSSPANYANVPTKMQVAATASTTVSSITGWRIYVDNVSVYVGGATTAISPLVTFTPGTHNVVVRAWAGDGSYGSQSRTVTVSSGTMTQVVVSVSTPSNNASSSSPVHFAATAATTFSFISGWHIYVDGVSAYSGAANNAISTDIPMSAGTHNIVVRAWAGDGTYGSQSRVITVGASTPPPAPTPLRLSTSTLPGGTAGTAYKATLTAQGGTSPYTWTLASGTLPAGLSLSTSGVISGTPTTSGSSYFSLSAKDSASSPQSATQALSIAVVASAQLTPPPQAAGYNLMFSDDFNSLNISPNGLGNYTWYNPGLFWETPAPASNISVSNSSLNLAWTSGQPTWDTSIATAAKDASYSRTWRYGYFEARMKWDTVNGSWPAFALFPVEGITCGGCHQGELDIFEGQGASPHTFTGTMHDWNNPTTGSQSCAQNYNLGSNVDLTQYHTYGALWVPGQVTWYLDNQPLYSCATYSIYDQQSFYMILSSQVGVNWNPGDTTGVTASKINATFDWVHVWQK
jgi:hypothetical protein